MEVRSSFSLAPLTTFRIGGPAKAFVELRSEEDIQTAVALARARGLPLFILGAGSNILVPDEGVQGLVAKMCLANVSFVDAYDEVIGIADAGVSWNTFVSAAAEQGLRGIENLAGIPGTVGGAVVQNIGAYGVELSQAFVYADCIDIQTGALHRVTNEDAAFAYRSSCFKYNRSFIIVRAAFRLTKDAELNLSYNDLARARRAGVPLLTPMDVVNTVRTIRSKKFPIPEEGGTAGSFFKNPIVSTHDAATLAVRFPGIPLFPQAPDTVKVSLAWLFDHVMSLKGYAKEGARLYEKQPIVIVAAEGTTATSVEILAEEVRARVYAETDVLIEREVETFGV